MFGDTWYINVLGIFALCFLASLVYSSDVSGNGIPMYQPPYKRFCLWFFTHAVFAMLYMFALAFLWFVGWAFSHPPMWLLN